MATKIEKERVYDVNSLAPSWRRRFGLAIGLAFACVAIALVDPVFVTPSNIYNIFGQSAVIGIVAAGMTFVIVCGGIDLSVGAVVALAGVVLALLLQRQVPTEIAISVTVLVGACCGLVNGCLIAWRGIPPFVATLGMYGAARGLALVLSDGRSIAGFSVPQFSDSSDPLLVLGAVYLCAIFIFHGTHWGTRLYAVGGNPRAAWLLGIRTRGYTVAVYIISGALSALGAIVLVGRLGAATPTSGLGYELDAIAAVVLGGAPLSGGTGSPLGTIIGILLLAVLRNGLTILNVSPYVQQIVTGAVLVVAALLDYRSSRRGLV